MGAHSRRLEEWSLQLALANKELEQIDKQIAAAEIRVAIAEKEIENQDKQIENGAAVEEFLQNKYTQQELYSWMLSQVSSVFFQSYKLAYDLAKRAEKAYRFERGLGSSNFVQFGYWDSLRKGLLSGERLALDLKRMELAYLDQSKREYELTKHISLVLHDPMALLTLRETGRCEFELPESLFTKDYLSHYMRRIKSFSLTIPCVIGPFTSINCTCTLMSSKIRVYNNAQMPYLEQPEDPRFVTHFGALESIATSHGQNDSGMFELNFHDERYLPFEGAGAISRWRIDLRRDCNAWDFDTITDVVLHMNLSAREGGELLGEKARAEVILPPPQNLARLFSAKHDFPSEWHRFLYPVDSATLQTLPLALMPERFPFPLRDRSIEISDIELFLKLKSGIEYPGSGQALALSLTPAEGTEVSMPLESADSFLNGLPHAVFDVSSDAKGFGTWTIAADEQDIAQLAPALRQAVTVDGVTHHHLKAEAIQDLLILPHYSVTG
jgi:hypothetical protein